MPAEPVKVAIAHVASRSAGAPLPKGNAVTLNFHPDASVGSRSLLDQLLEDGRYRSQFETAISNGDLTAYPGGERWEWERRIFGGAYDESDPELRPKYGALNYRHWEVGASPRFGSSHLRLRPHVLDRTTFCYPDSHLHPEHFGVRSHMALIALAQANERGLELLDDYIEAHVHGPIDVAADVEALVLDPCFRGTEIEEASRALPCRVEWHTGFRLPLERLQECAAYRGEDAASLLASIAAGGLVTPLEIGIARARGEDWGVTKRAWHCVARFGRSWL